MAVILEFIGRDGRTKSLRIKSDTLIGRGSDCRLRIRSERVSRKHCILRVENGKVFVKDLGSTNGTFVDGDRLRPHEEIALEDGLEISIGPARARIQMIAAGQESVRVGPNKASALTDLYPAWQAAFDEHPSGMNETLSIKSMETADAVEEDGDDNYPAPPADDDELDDFLSKFD